MNAKKVLLVAMIALLATGCTKHTIVADRTLKVGNIYCSDGSVMDPDTYKSEGRDNAAGVIFWVNDTLDTENKAYIVSLSNARKNIWCDSLVSTGVSTLIDQYDGAANTAMLQTFEVRTGAKAPAMKIAVNFSEGIANWHLPSVKELILRRSAPALRVGRGGSHHAQHLPSFQSALFMGKTSAPLYMELRP